MERMVTDTSVNKVLAICDEKYANKADGREGGVGTETQIISKDIYDKVKQEKFVPLIRERDGEGKEFVPVFFRNRKYIDFSSYEAFGESYDKLLRIIFGRPELKKPQLGRPPAHIFADDALHVKTAGKLDRLKDAVQRQKPHAHAVLQEYLDVFADSMEDFRITYDPKAAASFDEQVVSNIKGFIPYRDNFVDFLIFVANYMNDPDAYDRIFEFLDRILSFKERPENVTSWTEISFDNYRFILYELFLYLIATLVKNKRYAMATRFMEDEYHYASSRGGSGYVKEGPSAFNSANRSIDEVRNQRLSLNRYSVVADLIVERATHAKVSLADILQADFLIFFRPYVLNQAHKYEWFPRCMGYLGRSGTLEAFAKVTSPRGFEAAGQLFGAKNLSDLYSKMQAALRDPRFNQIVQSRTFMFTSLEDVLNWSAISRQLQSNG